MKKYDLDPKLRSPHHPDALCLADVMPDVGFIRVLPYKSPETGIFLTEPFMSGNWPYARVRMDNRVSTGFETLLFLEDAGIIPCSDSPDGELKWSDHYMLPADYPLQD